MLYDIYTRATGQGWGSYESDTPEDAIRAMLEDGGEDDPDNVLGEFEAVPAHGEVYKDI